MLDHLKEHVDKPFAIYELLAPSMSNNISSLVFGKRLKYNDPDRMMMTRVLKETAAAAGQAAWQLFFPKLKRILEILHIGDVNKIEKIQQELRSYTK